MPEDEKEEPQDQAPTAEDLEAIKAHLEEEKKARTAVEQTLAQKESRIIELESQLSEVDTAVLRKAKELEASLAEIAALKEAYTIALAKYRDALIKSHPEVPQDLIQGDSIDALFNSIEKGKAIVESVKAAMASEAAHTRVPAGAPTRGAISLEGLSPKAKIAYGIQQKGGI